MTKHTKGCGELDLELKQVQQLTLTPALKQSLHILAMPALELSIYLVKQMEQNPVLEVEEYSNEEESLLSVTGQDVSYDEQAYEENWQRFLNAAYYEPHLYTAALKEAAPPQLCAILPAGETGELATLLRLQLALTQAPRTHKAAAELIIAYLDEDGYFSLPLSSLAAASVYSEEILAEALKLVQSLEPAGVAARDLGECLRLQISDQDSERELLCAIIDKHLPDVAAHRVKETARAQKVNAARVEVAFAHIRSLSPRPAASYSGSNTAPYVKPDVIIHRLNREYLVLLNDNLLPHLTINPYYQRPDPLLLQDEAAAGYIKHSLNEANSLLRNIEKRRQTLYKLALLTLEHQHGFISRGLSELAPWTMKEAAQELNLHESTVSRAIAGKYIQTPRGLYPWKFFFPHPSSARAGARTSAWAKEQLKQIVAAEDKTNPFTDQRLSELLAERGVYIGRRTVTKYREELGIEPRQWRRRAYVIRD